MRTIFFTGKVVKVDVEPVVGGNLVAAVVKPAGS